MPVLHDLDLLDETGLITLWKADHLADFAIYGSQEEHVVDLAALGVHVIHHYMGPPGGGLGDKIK